jgi:predicted RNA-binding Zn-ribbon protein involved in translation (DUF1610 family)
VPRPCDECGETIPLSRQKNARFCSDRCGKRAWWRAHRQRKAAARLPAVTPDVTPTAAGPTGAKAPPRNE